MSEYSNMVNHRRKVLNAEIWARKTKEMMMVANKSGQKTWTTTYNDGSIETEYWNSDNLIEKTVKTNPTLTIQECIDQMSREEADAAF